MFGLGLGSMGLLKSSLSLAGKIKNLFAAGQNGGWYNFGLLTQEYQDSAGTVAVTAVEQPLGKVNDISGRANHLTQATAGARPVVSARVNLLTQTEAFGTGSWINASGYTYTQNALQAGNIFLTNAVPTVAVSTRPVYQSTTIVGEKRFNVLVKANGYRYIQMYDQASGVIGSVVFDAQAGVFTQNNLGLSTTVTSLGNGVYDAGIVFTNALALAMGVGISNTATVASAFGDAFAGDAVNGILLGGFQLSTTPALVAYQQVTDSTIYNTAGFPFYSKFDGIDDSLSSTTGGGATSGFFFCQAVKPLTQNALRTLWSDTGTNTGIKVQLDAANKLSLSAGNGITYTTVVTAATVPLGDTSLVTAWDDGTNFNVQVGNGAVAQIARILPTAGTAATTVGKDNGAATSYFNGNLYPAIIRSGTPLTATERASAQAWCKSKAGL